LRVNRAIKQIEHVYSPATPFFAIAEKRKGAQTLLPRRFGYSAVANFLKNDGSSTPVLTFASGFEKTFPKANKEEKSMKIGETAPDFEAETTEGRIHFHDWIGDSWAVLFSHPKDFTPVCTTELGYMAKIKPEFDRRNVKVIGLSVDSTGDHQGWAKDIEETQGHAPNYPIVGDADFRVSKLYGMLPADIAGDPKKRTPADNATVRNVYVIGPDKKIKLMLAYPMTTGRNFDEVLRVIDSLQLTARHQVATPVNWKPGEEVIIAGSVSDDEAKRRYPQGWKAPKPYIRIVPQPQ
jgi:thioredoxin-dependent peroxiredoxin